jgi:hypothetical protein
MGRPARHSARFAAFAYVPSRFLSQFVSPCRAVPPVGSVLAWAALPALLTSRQTLRCRSAKQEVGTRQEQYEVGGSVYFVFVRTGGAGAVQEQRSRLSRRRYLTDVRLRGRQLRRDCLPCKRRPLIDLRRVRRIGTQARNTRTNTDPIPRFRFFALLLSGDNGNRRRSAAHSAVPTR